MHDALGHRLGNIGDGSLCFPVSPVSAWQERGRAPRGGGFFLVHIPKRRVKNSYFLQKCSDFSGKKGDSSTKMAL